MRYSESVRNAGLDARIAVIGPSPMLELRAGVAPARLTSTPKGDLLATGQAPEDWMQPANAGMKSMRGLWEMKGIARGMASYLRVLDASGTVCHLLAEIPNDAEIDSAFIVPQQIVNVTLFNLRAGNE